MKSRLSLDTAALGVLAILTALFGVVAFLGARAGVRVTTNLPERSLIGPFQNIQLSFSEPVDPELAESLFSIQPSVTGQINWLDPRTLQFVPARPFELGTDYKLTLNSGGGICKR